jgi:ubiquinone/menaquinone biosynthesis C-methylase UbiE
MLITGERNNKDSPEPSISSQKPPLIAAVLSEFEDGIARDFYRRTGLDYKTTIQRIIETAEPFPGMQVLDIPTGTGVIARQFAKKVGEKGKIIGADETRDKLERARLAAQSAKLSLYIEWRTMTTEKLCFDNHSLDLITSWMALHRLPAERFLAEAYRVLKPGGCLLIADELVPEVGSNSLLLSARRTYYRYIARDKEQANSRFYSRDELIEALNAAGFGALFFRDLRQRGKRDRVFTLIKAVKNEA